VQKVLRIRSTLNTFGKVGVLLAASITTAGLSGCLVAGASSGGWFVWPGGLALLVVVLLIVFAMRRR
jgi:hypothetical protein